VGFAVSVAVGQPSLKLPIDDNLDRYLDVGVEGDTLRIGLRRVSSVSDATLQATATAPSLAQLQGSGSSRVHLQDRLAGDELRVELSGASRLDGASSLRYRGSPTLTRQDVSGGSSITRVG
jgi:hypothetical protein